MRFMKDSEKDQLKRLVKACMLEISKLKMELKKSREMNKECEKSNDLEYELEKRDMKIQELEKLITDKEKSIKSLNNSLNEKNSYIKDLEEIKGYFEALTAKPKRDLTSFQFQVYQLLPAQKTSTQKMHSFLKKVGFKELSYDNMFHILKNLERKGYFRSYDDNGDVLWQKIEK